MPFQKNTNLFLKNIKKQKKDEFFYLPFFVSKNRFKPLLKVVGIIIQNRLKTPLYSILRRNFSKIIKNQQFAFLLQKNKYLISSIFAYFFITSHAENRKS